ncbi:DUF4394 domain-containing protein [Hymenobacter tibetensis]|uniref:DUF4394 domain-containing protein n=1 Tax=Hymenobacter tibetensis TaxID=497967 RepID=A0ABY4CVS9_9BACT|nr:DUF4394 domain-containing protein [Hymenobacter tibetensis]UOG73091.1 DUF4394 domain-containing protein [Hymenobacter tibetensis]
MKKTSYCATLAACAALFFALAGCEKEMDEYAQNGNTSISSDQKGIPFSFYALAEGTKLDAFTTQDPENPTRSVPIAGLQSGETILAIDFRPATGQLYGVGSTSRIYVIDPLTGAARAIGTGPFMPLLEGSVAGFDFNPTVDRIRLVTNTGQNLRLNPETGALAMEDGDINGAPGASVAAVAYTNNVAGAATTTLYDIDVATQTLYKQDPPNAGTLVKVGPLKLKVTGEGGFDIAPDNTALGLFEVNKKATLFSVDLATGDTRILVKYNKGLMYTGIAIPTQPIAYAVTAANSLLIFNPENPSATVAKTITGLQTGETIVGIDFRPATGQLYAIGSNSRIYTLNTSSGAAAFVATLTVPLSGTAFGVDFNPTVDRIRIVSNTSQNLRVIPANVAAGTAGTVTTDTPLNPGTPAVTGAAYTNNFAGATTTALYDIDTTSDKLFLQNPPNAGALVPVGDLGVDVDAANGFDIGGTSGTPYALLTSGGSTKLYRISTSNGVATSVGNFTSAATGLAVGLGF